MTQVDQGLWSCVDDDDGEVEPQAVLADEQIYWNRFSQEMKRRRDDDELLGRRRWRRIVSGIHVE